MPRDGNGNYTLPAGNPVVSGTLIESAWANDTMEDVAIALTNSLSRNGNGGMLAPLGFIDGAIGAPGMYFNSQVNMGLFRNALNDLRIVMNGASSLQITETYVNVEVPELQVQTIPVITEAGGQAIAGTTTLGKAILNGDLNVTLDIDRPSSGVVDFQMRNDDAGAKFRMSSGNLSIVQTDATGANEDTWIGCTKDGQVTLSYDGSVKLATASGGISVTGDADVSGTVNAAAGAFSANTLNLVTGIRTNANPAFMGVANTEGGCGIRADGDGFRLYRTDAALSLSEIWIAGNGDAEVSLYYDNAVKFFTESGGAQCNGDLQATGDVQGGVSDIRCKDISSWINPRKCLNAILDWGVIRYTEKEMHPDSKIGIPQIGLIAQQVQGSFPELTPLAPFDKDDAGHSVSGNDYLTLKYDRAVSVLVGALQALHMDLEACKRDIAKLRGDYP